MDDCRLHHDGNVVCNVGNGRVWGDMSGAPADIEIVKDWFQKCSDNCRTMGKTESALLWKDGLAHIEKFEGVINKIVSVLHRNLTPANKLAQIDAALREIDR
jgi:hypothetical protein